MRDKRGDRELASRQIKGETQQEKRREEEVR